MNRFIKMIPTLFRCDAARVAPWLGVDCPVRGCDFQELTFAQLLEGCVEPYHNPFTTQTSPVAGKKVGRGEDDNEFRVFRADLHFRD